MKITKNQLRRIIREEKARLINEADSATITKLFKDLEFVVEQCIQHGVDYHILSKKLKKLADYVVSRKFEEMAGDTLLARK